MDDGQEGMGVGWIGGWMMDRKVDVDGKRKAGTKEGINRKKLCCVEVGEDFQIQRRGLGGGGG